MRIRFQTGLLFFLLVVAVSVLPPVASRAQNPAPGAVSGAVTGAVPTAPRIPPGMASGAVPAAPPARPFPAPVPGAASANIPPKPEAVALADYGRVKETIADLIKSEMRKNDVVGLSIALVDDQRVVWAQGFGYADEEKKIAATPETIYRAGTLTRLFTTAAVMQLAEQGKLDIDRPLKEYLPEFSVKSRFNNAGPITLRSLMTNHSGLPSRSFKGMWSKKPEPFTKVLDQIRDDYVAYPPGFIYSNSDLGFTLLGIVLQKVTGRDFISSLDETLLKPMNMAGSSLLPAPGKNSGATKSYRKGREIDEPLCRDVPAYGLKTTVTDISRLMQMVFAQGRFGSRQILKPETLSEMFRVQNSQAPLDFGLQTGLGWMLSGFGEVNIKNAGPVARFGGATLLHRSQLMILPAQKLGVVVMSNTSSTSTVTKVAARALTLAFELKSGIKQAEPKMPVEVDATLSQTLLQSYEGRYATMFGVGSITPNGDHFDVEIVDRSFHLLPHADGKFGVRYKVFSFIPWRLRELDYVSIFRERVAGRDVLVINNRGRELLVGEKIKPVPISGAWQKRVGYYRIENIGDDVSLVEKTRLRLDNGIMLVEFSLPLLSNHPVSFALEPVSDTEAIICGLGSGMAETVRVISSGGREELYYSGYVLRKK